MATERQGESVHKKIRVLSSRLTSAIRLVVHREAIAGAVSEAAEGIEAWSAKLEALKQGFFSEGLDTQAVDLMLGFDTVASSLPVRYAPPSGESLFSARQRRACVC